MQWNGLYGFKLNSNWVQTDHCSTAQTDGIRTIINFRQCISAHLRTAKVVHFGQRIDREIKWETDREQKLNQILENQFVIERNTLFRRRGFGGSVALFFLIIIGSRSWSTGMRRGCIHCTVSMAISMTVAMSCIGCIVLIVG